jgi:hypothetical protein
VLPDTQQVAPVHPVPPHCPYLAAQEPPDAALVLVDGAAEVFVDVTSVVDEVGGLAVVWGLPPPDAPHVKGSGPGIV